MGMKCYHDHDLVRVYILKTFLPEPKQVILSILARRGRKVDNTLD